MKVTLYKSNSRGHRNHGWLDTHFSFSFADYYNPDRVHFGALRVLNDDVISPGMGFGKHPHDNMEIISIPLNGVLEHKDSMGHVQRLSKNEIQVMSAGTGIYHSEKNGSTTENAELLQIWIIPENRDVSPRYDQIKFDPELRRNTLFNIVGPKDSGSPLWINQQTWLYLSNLNKGYSINYEIQQEEHGLFVFVIEGKLKLGDTVLEARDAIQITDTNRIKLLAEEDCYFLLINIPLLS